VVRHHSTAAEDAVKDGAPCRVQVLRVFDIIEVELLAMEDTLTGYRVSIMSGSMGWSVHRTSKAELMKIF